MANNKEQGLALLSQVLTADEQQLLESWISEQLGSKNRRADLLRENDLRQQSTEFVRLVKAALVRDSSQASIHSPAWSDVRDLLARLSRSRANLGFTPAETAHFALSFKQVLFERLRTALDATSDGIVDAILLASNLFDSLALYTIEVHQKAREEIIVRQQEEMLELSTPVVKLWDGILALPLIGTLDSNRTQIVMESLLQAIVDTGSEVAIIDITGVPTVDTLVSQHLLKTVAAARLMGADCIISGIRPQIAQTIVHLGVDLTAVSTKASLAEAFVLALKRTGRTIGRSSGGAPALPQ